MRPRQSRLGISRRRSTIESRRLSFNEAEAITPRNPKKMGPRMSNARRSFNEAEAITPRNPQLCHVRKTREVSLQ